MFLGEMSFFRKLLFLALVIGLAAGVLLAFLTGVLLELVEFPWIFLVAACTTTLVAGGAVAFCARMALRQSLRQQFAILRPWQQETSAATHTVEGLTAALQEVIA
jgi:uncharacterized membrane protein